MQLPDLTLDHPLAENLQKALGCFKRQRHEAGTETGGDDDRPIYLKLLQIIPALLRNPVRTRVSLSRQLKIAGSRALPDQPVGGAQRNIQGCRQLPLRRLRMLP